MRSTGGEDGSQALSQASAPSQSPEQDDVGADLPTSATLVAHALENAFAGV